MSLLAEGERLLAGGCVGHNYYRFYRNAMEACIDAADWPEVRRYADALAAYVTEEPNPWSDYFISRAHAIADAGEGKGDSDRIQSLILTGGDAALMASVPGLSSALEDLGPAGSQL